MHPPFELCIGAHSVYDAIAATDVCEPAGSSLTLHRMSIRDRIIHGAMGAWHWVDIWDMLADGLTNGGIDRALPHGVGNDCKYKAVHEALVHIKHKARF